MAHSKAKQQYQEHRARQRKGYVSVLSSLGLDRTENPACGFAAIGINSDLLIEYDWVPSELVHLRRNQREPILLRDRATFAWCVREYGKNERIYGECFSTLADAIRHYQKMASRDRVAAAQIR